MRTATILTSLILAFALTACGGSGGEADSKANPCAKADANPCAKADAAPAANPCAAAPAANPCAANPCAANPCAKADATAKSDQLTAFLGTLSEADKTKKPAAEPSAEAIAKAAKQYDTVCMSCHGPKGAGDGPAAAALKPAPANFQSKDRLAATTDGEKYAILKKGIAGTGMVGLAAGWTDEQVWAMIRHVESFAGE